MGDSSLETSSEQERIRSSVFELKEAITRLLVVAIVFPTTLRTEKLFSEWSLKDLLAHLSGWNKQTIETLEKVTNGIPISSAEWILDLDNFNAKNVEIRSEIDWQDIVKEFKESSELLLHKYSEVPEQLWTKQIGTGISETASELIDVDIAHILEHLEQVRAVEESFRE